MGFSKVSGSGALLIASLGFLFLSFSGSSPVLAEKLEHLIKLNKVAFEVPIRVVQDSPVTLRNDWGIPLHQTSIAHLDSGASLARIQTVMAGQTLSLEFPREGAYSICYFLTPEQQPGKERCFYIDVVPLKTA